VPTVADVIAGGLVRAGVRALCVPVAARGSALVDAARRCELPVTVAASELGACLIAAVLGELGGIPGAALTGDDAMAAAAPGLAYARAEWAPLIVVTEGDGRAASPSFDGIAKQSLRVEPASAAHWIAHGARLALGEPPGPVHLQVSGAARSAALPVAARVTPDPAIPPEESALDRAAEAIARARRPLIVAGRGARRPSTAEWVRAFAEARPAPVLATLKGRGVMPDPHPLALGTIGPLAAEIVSRADLVIAVGVDLAELGDLAWPPVAVLQVGLAPAGSALAVAGEPALTFEELAPRLRDAALADWDVAELDRVKRARAGRRPAGAWVAEIARELSPAGTIAAVDAGTNAPGVIEAWQATRPGELLASSVLGLPGFALPAAIAAQLASPGDRALCFTSAPGLLPVLGELATAAHMARGPIVIAAPDGGAGAPSLAGVLPPALGLRIARVDGRDAFARALDASLATQATSVLLVGDGPAAPLAFGAGPR
jgi:acetolactate synthase-1/2/3 large subunit